MLGKNGGQTGRACAALAVISDMRQVPRGVLRPLLPGYEAHSRTSEGAIDPYKTSLAPLEQLYFSSLPILEQRYKTFSSTVDKSLLLYVQLAVTVDLLCRWQSPASL